MLVDIRLSVVVLGSETGWAGREFFLQQTHIG